MCAGVTVVNDFPRSDPNLSSWRWRIVNASPRLAPRWSRAPFTRCCYHASRRKVCCFGESAAPGWWLLSVGGSSDRGSNVLFKDVKRSSISVATLPNKHDSKVFVRNFAETELSLESCFPPSCFTAS